MKLHNYGFDSSENGFKNHDEWNPDCSLSLRDTDGDMWRQVIPAILKSKLQEMYRVKAKVEITVPAPRGERAGVHSSIEKTLAQIEKISARGNKLTDLTGNEWIQESVAASRQRSLGAAHPHTSVKIREVGR